MRLPSSAQFRLVPCPKVPWYRAAPASVANPRHVPSARAINRFNGGQTGYQLLYFAPNPQTALFEARALLGFITGPFAPAAPSPRSWTIFRYQIQNGIDVVDFGQPVNRAAVDTTVQELTGDWEGYHVRRFPIQPTSPAIVSQRIHAPTQELGAWLSARNYQGFLSPSARNPLIQNLVLFYNTLPNNSVWVTGSRRLIL